MVKGGDVDSWHAEPTGEEEEGDAKGEATGEEEWCDAKGEAVCGSGDGCFLP